METRKMDSLCIKHGKTESQTIPSQVETAVVVAPASSLTDIWLLMGIAFGWTIFIIRNLFRPSFARYATGGIHIRGNVLESKVDTSSSIPAYQALIDYSYEDSSGKSYQVRKSFKTSKYLAVGFGNVNIVLLPNDPTSGLLVTEWQNDYERELRERSSHRTPLYLTLFLGFVFVVLSMVGAVRAVLKLPEGSEVQGWISLGCGSVLLWPLAFFLYRYTGSCVVATRQSVEDGLIIQGDIPQPSCIDSCTGQTAACGDLLDGLEMPASSNKTKNSAFPTSFLRCGPDTATTEEESKFYFVCMPNGANQFSTSDSGSSISSVSMKSLKQKESTSSMIKDDMTESTPNLEMA